MRVRKGKGKGNTDKRKMLCIDAVVMLVLFAFDQLTKFMVVARLKGNAPLVLIDGVLELQYLENRGVAFSMLQNQKGMIVLIGVIFLAVLCCLLMRVPTEDKFRWVHILLSVIVAGGVGNLIDRLRLDYVVDFISFVLINYPIFNVADIYIVVATICLFVLFVFVFQEQDLEFMDFGKKENLSSK